MTNKADNSGVYQVTARLDGLSNLKLRFLKDCDGYLPNEYKKGQIINYRPWNYEFNRMSESERIEKGLFVFCYSQGDFACFKKGIDVEVVNG